MDYCSGVARHDRHLDALRSLRLFSACTSKELEQIARLTDEVAVPAGHRIVTQGEPGREAFVIVDGTASVLLGDSPIADLGPGQHFGELALLDGGTRTANVDAVTDMTLLVIYRPAFMGLLDEQPGIARRVMATITGSAALPDNVARPPRRTRRSRLRDFRAGVYMQTLLRDPAAGLMHSMIYFGFLALLGVTTDARDQPPAAREPEVPPRPHLPGLQLRRRPAGLVFLVGIVWAIVRRYVQRPYRIRIKSKPEHALILGVLPAHRRHRLRRRGLPHRREGMPRLREVVASSATRSPPCSTASPAPRPVAPDLVGHSTWSRSSPSW
jgi:hypothetical protein